MLNHYLHKQKISAYIDGELNPDATKALEEHLQACNSCQAELTAIRAGKALTAHFEKPEWQASEKLWARLQGAQSGTNSKANFPQASWDLKLGWPSILKLRSPWLWAAALVVLFLIARNMVQIQIARQPENDNRMPIQAASAFAIDFGLYLDALKNGREPVEFERQYGGKVTTYERAKARANFDLPTLPKMPEAFELSEVQTLGGSCCFSIQLNCVNDSERIIIFQQPKEHPATFGSYKLMKMEMNGRNCFQIKVGSWTALCWDDEDSQYVVVSELEADELARALRELM